MLLPENFRIIFYTAYIFTYFRLNPVLGLFKLEDSKLEEYYLGSSRIYSLEYESKVKKREVSSDSIIFSIKLSDKVGPYTAIIRRRKSDVVLGDTAFFQILNGKASNKSTTQYHNFEDISLFEGYLFEDPISSINGYIKENFFYGHIIVNNTFYYVDEFKQETETVGWKPIKKKEQEENAVIYTRKSVIFTAVEDGILIRTVFQKFTRKDFLRMFQTWKKRGTLCKLIIVIDYSFLTLIHRGNIQAATNQILFSLEEANAIFRSTDFDGDGTPDNIGFYVGKIVVIDSSENLYFITPYNKEFMSVNEFIYKFRRYKELENHCLGIIFTAQKFKLRTLGASFSADNKNFVGFGGICDSKIPVAGSFNALVITVVTDKYNPVPQFLFEVTITHELGHSFGSSHDDDETTNCSNHIMAAKTHQNYEGSRLRFSSCSKERILRTLVMKGECFERANTSFCGNGLVEENEQCDCGLIRDCLKMDPCCIPRRTKDYPCRVNKKLGYECHPSQGECCTEQCTYSGLLQNYINCRNFDQICPCADTNTKCSCGINGMCIENECHSIECTRIGLKECQCLKEKRKISCSVCCEYKNHCVSALEVTNRIIAEEKNNKIFKELFSQKIHSKYQEKNWIPKKYCSEPSSTKAECFTLYFSKGETGDYCLLKGKLGKCNKDFDCEVSLYKQSFPKLKSKGCVIFDKKGFYLCILMLKINIFS